MPKPIKKEILYSICIVFLIFISASCRKAGQSDEWQKTSGLDVRSTLVDHDKGTATIKYYDGSEHTSALDDRALSYENQLLKIDTISKGGKLYRITISSPLIVDGSNGTTAIDMKSPSKSIASAPAPVPIFRVQIVITYTDFDGFIVTVGPPSISVSPTSFTDANHVTTYISVSNPHYSPYPVLPRTVVTAYVGYDYLVRYSNGQADYFSSRIDAVTILATSTPL